MRRNSEIGMTGVAKHDNSRRESAVSKLRKERGSSESSETLDRSWEELEGWELEAALEDGVMTLESEIKDQMGQIDLAKLEKRVLDLLKNGVDVSVMSESDQQLFETTRADMLQDLEEFSVTEQALLQGKEVDAAAVKAEQEALMDAPEVQEGMRVEQASAPAEAMADVKRVMADKSKAEMLANQARGEMANIMTEESFAEMSKEESEKYGTSRLEADALLQNKEGLGSPDVPYSSADEFDAALKGREATSQKIREIQKSNGFFSKLFGKGAREIANAKTDLASYDRGIQLTREFIRQNQGAMNRLDRPASSSSTSKTRRTNRRPKAASGRGSMTGV